MFYLLSPKNLSYLTKNHNKNLFISQIPNQFLCGIFKGHFRCTQLNLLPPKSFDHPYAEKLKEAHTEQNSEDRALLGFGRSW